MKQEWKIEEYEKLGWYELISKMGLESFNWAGTDTWDQLFQMADLPSNANILLVGCGVGKSAFYIAQKYGFHVVGIDLAEESIQIAQERAKSLGIDTLVSFDIGDAHRLPYPNSIFDAVFTEFMAYFLNHTIAIPEFFRVIKPGGHIGFNELMLDLNTPQEPLAEIQYAGKMFKEFSGYQLTIPTTSEYLDWIKNAGFQEIEFKQSRSKKSLKNSIEATGGFKKFWKIMKLTLYLYRNSPIIKQKFEKQAIVKKIVMHQRKTAKYIIPTLCLGKKNQIFDE